MLGRSQDDKGLLEQRASQGDWRLSQYLRSRANSNPHVEVRSLDYPLPDLSRVAMHHSGLPAPDVTRIDLALRRSVICDSNADPQ